MREKAWPYVGSEKYLDQFRNDSRQYFNSLAVFPHNNRTRLHGLVGIYSNGTRSWTPGTMPPPIDQSPAGRDAELKDGGFYLRLSNALPLDREVPDLREDVCRRQRFALEDLEDVSIVITFYNEHTSTLLRSVHSVLNNTPPPLLREIILVDDHSNVTDVAPGGYLDAYLPLLPKTKVLRLPERRGLVQARLSGAKIAKAPIFVVLDSHIEVGQGWLEPLVKRLAESPKSVVFPQIMSLDPVTFDYRRDSGISCFLSFKWMMQERPYFDPPKHADPVASPSMAGGLFAVRRDWFYDLGGYDEEMKMWGAENVEMGFRYWMCGGRVECMPCSWTYHIYRHGGVGYKSPGKYISRNRARTAIAWLGPYWQIAREFMGKGDDKDLGPFDKVRALKAKHNCRSFDWFLQNVDPTRYGTNYADYGMIGEVRNVGFQNRCLDSLQQKSGGKPLGSYGCHGEKGAQGWFEIKSDHQIRNMASETICAGKDLKLTHCETKGVDDLWVTLPQFKWIAAAEDADTLKHFKRPAVDETLNNEEAETLLERFTCLGFTDDKKNLTMAPCKTGNKLIQWEFNLFKWDPDYEGPEELLA
ncbi:glycosyltransferase family protein [Gregarina niphandrodes]|uniref:Glycosyltransferase family protein n=1 Tax=Gregarina niphandrodes TaxID=110365 RepID=A0A023B8G7_GRENI|nr:glycosyltransferase family protein [Gregarina niphandrodes]EZG69128.1 glycosyltransferase family protein [Gregarina niphandrodes]|eukprot:XP_011134477.1 glycosyltransferase family protein [Gregarina niphandrodes]